MEYIDKDRNTDQYKILERKFSPALDEEVNNNNNEKLWQFLKTTK